MSGSGKWNGRHFTWDAVPEGVEVHSGLKLEAVVSAKYLDGTYCHQAGILLHVLITMHVPASRWDSYLPGINLLLEHVDRVIFVVRDEDDDADWPGKHWSHFACFTQGPISGSEEIQEHASWVQAAINLVLETNGISKRTRQMYMPGLMLFFQLLIAEACKYPSILDLYADLAEFYKMFLEIPEEEHWVPD